jgi:hypothetical protein
MPVAAPCTITRPAPYRRTNRLTTASASLDAHGGEAG